MNDLETATNQILEKYKAAVYARDAAAFMKLYDSEARVFDTWEIWSYEGASSRKPAIDAWFNSLGAERVKVDFDDVQCIGTPKFAFVSAVATYTAVSAQGERLRSMQNRLTWGLRTSEQDLKIVHEHTSVPVGFDDAKAILQRKASPRAAGAE